MGNKQSFTFSQYRAHLVKRMNKARKWIMHRHRDEFVFANEIYEHLCCFVVSEPLEFRSVSLTEACIHALMMRILKGLFSVMKLIEAGAQEDAMTIERTLIDYYVSLKLIASRKEEDDNPLAQRFFEHRSIGFEKSFQRFRKHISSDQLEKGHNLNFREWMPKAEKFKKQNHPYNGTWHGKTMSELIKQLGLSHLQSGYGMGCEMAHPSWVARRFLNDQLRDDIKPDPFPRIWEPSSLFVAQALALDAVRTYLERYSENRVKWPKFIVSAHEQLNRIWGKYG